MPFSPIDGFLGKLNKRVFLAFCLVLQGLVFWADWVTDPVISLSVFYLGPIFLVAWYVGKRAAYLLTVLATFGASYDFLHHFSFHGWFLTLTYTVIKECLINSAFCFFILQLKQSVDTIIEQGQTDSLTQAGSRKFFLEESSAELVRSYRYKRPVSLAFIDIDDFKEVNDRYGHEKGDQLLVKVASTIKSDLREGDFLGRLGGDEFVILLHETNQQQAKHIMERMRTNLLSAVQPFRCRVTFSIGVVTYLADKKTSIDELVAVADKAMYFVKNCTKNDLQFIVV